MKKLICILIPLLFFLQESAIALSESSDPRFLIVTFTRNYVSGGGVHIREVDGSRIVNIHDTRMRDANGEVLVFESHITALTYLDDKGWELVSSYAKKDDFVYHILKKKERTNAY